MFKNFKVYLSNIDPIESEWGFNKVKTTFWNFIEDTSAENLYDVHVRKVEKESHPSLLGVIHTIYYELIPNENKLKEQIDIENRLLTGV